MRGKLTDVCNYASGIRNERPKLLAMQTERAYLLDLGEKSVILFHSLAQYSDMFTSYHCTIKQCNPSTGTYINLLLLHITTTRVIY